MNSGVRRILGLQEADEAKSVGFRDFIKHFSKPKRTGRFYVMGLVDGNAMYYWRAGLPSWHWSKQGPGSDSDRSYNDALNIARNMRGKPVTWPQLDGPLVSKTYVVSVYGGRGEEVTEARPGDARNFLKQVGKNFDYTFCRRCGADLKQPESVLRHYTNMAYDPEADEDVDQEGAEYALAGHYQGEYFEPDERPGIPLNGYDLLDGSDECAKCGYRE